MLKPALRELEIMPKASSSCWLNLMSRCARRKRRTNRGTGKSAAPMISEMKTPSPGPIWSDCVEVMTTVMMAPATLRAMERSSIRLAGSWMRMSSSSVFASSR